MSDNNQGRRPPRPNRGAGTSQQPPPPRAMQRYQGGSSDAARALVVIEEYARQLVNILPDRATGILPARNELIYARYCAAQYAASQAANGKRHLSLPDLEILSLRAVSLRVDPMYAIPQLFIVDGNVGASVALMRALIHKSGLLRPPGRLEIPPLNQIQDTRECQIIFVRADQPDTEYKGFYDMKLAEAARLTNNEKKPAWFYHWPRMLMVRALGLAFTIGAEDVIGGLYTLDELAEIANRRGGSDIDQFVIDTDIESVTGFATPPEADHGIPNLNSLPSGEPEEAQESEPESDVVTEGWANAESLKQLGASILKFAKGMGYTPESKSEAAESVRAICEEFGGISLNTKDTDSFSLWDDKFESAEKAYEFITDGYLAWLDQPDSNESSESAADNDDEPEDSPDSEASPEQKSDIPSEFDPDQNYGQTVEVSELIDRLIVQVFGLVDDDNNSPLTGAFCEMLGIENIDALGKVWGKAIEHIKVKIADPKEPIPILVSQAAYRADHGLVYKTSIGGIECRDYGPGGRSKKSGRDRMRDLGEEWEEFAITFDETPKDQFVELPDELWVTVKPSSKSNYLQVVSLSEEFPE